MVLPPSGSLNQGTVLLHVETNWFNFYIRGKPFHPTVESLQLHREGQGVNAHLLVSALGSSVTVEKVSAFDPEKGELAEWQPGEWRNPLFYETQAYQVVVEKKEDIALTFHHESVHLRQAVEPLGQMILAGELNFQNEVGLTELQLRLHGEPIFQVQLEIFPAKMDYQNDYRQILHDVNQQIYNLSFDFLRKTYHMTGLRETGNQSLTEFFTILQVVFGQLVQAVERIQASPHASMRVENRVVEAARIRKAGRETVAYLTKRPHLLVEDEKQGFVSMNGRMYTPSHALEARRQVDYNTQENRFVRWVLVRVSKKLNELKTRLTQGGRMQDPLLAKRIQGMQGQLQRLLGLDFLQVGEMRQLTVTLVLQMAPGYRQVHRHYLMLMKGLSVQSDLFKLSLKDVAQLYEYWCFLKIHELLRRKYELVSQDLVRVNRTGLFVTLDRTQKAKMTYRNPLSGEVFTLYYNALPPRDHSKTLGQKPDNVLTLKKNDSPVEYKYIFDAKYRMNPAIEGTPYYNAYKTPGPVEDDINTMHRYRDAIVYAEGSGHELEREYERSMFGAYVLFPYGDEEKFREHKFYRSIGLVNVGAFPFLPNATSLMEAFLDEIILDSPEKAYERSIRPRGTKDYYRNKLEGKNVIVGSMRSGPVQLEAALKHGFYHLPLKNLTEQKILTQLEYVALYQSIKGFGRNGEVGVHWYGLISDWKVVRRCEITEIPYRPGTADDLYVKLTVEEWKRMERPVMPGGRGIHTLLLTSKYMLDRAVEIAELKLESEADLAQWREKRRQGPVRVELDHKDVDLAKRVLGVEVQD
ncbi:DUF2357 domain-containing protein [Paenibacillus chitinolyticus]|uniref:DUF2357 domain-containing protein n=1 Tax=Paenibacillus chitinolyticus TaxID=79263 RepID=UPI00364136CB